MTSLCTFPPQFKTMESLQGKFISLVNLGIITVFSLMELLKILLDAQESY